MIHGRLAFVRLSVGATLAALLVLVAFDAYSPLVFYASGLICLLLVTELTATEGVRPRWRRRVRGFTWLLVAGFAVFGAVRIWRILEAVS